MARRRQQSYVDPTNVELPEKLAAGPTVEVWVRPDELPPASVGLDIRLMQQVSRRFKGARQEWADRHGVAPADTFRMFPDRRVRFADPVRQQMAFGGPA